MIETTNFSYIYIDSFNHPSNKSVKDIKKVCIKCAAAFLKGFGASPPMQLTMGHFTLQFYEIDSVCFLFLSML